MGKITGMEAANQLPPKVLLLYDAVEKLIASGADINAVRVSAITELAGIGKGTAYDYFETKEDIIACALLYQIRMLAEELRDIFSEERSFAKQLSICMDEIDKQDEKQQRLTRYVHVLMVNTGYCQLIKEKMKQKEFEEYLPLHILEEAIIKGRERGEIRPEIPVEYAIYVVASKLVTYMAICNRKNGMERQREKIRPYAYQSMISELCEKSV